MITKLEEYKPRSWYDKENYYFYRGVENKEYTLKPSISVLELEQFERHLIHDFATLKPEEFYTTKSTFEMIGKMQHHGLPTRLLDFSLNPLVALYFACTNYQRENETADGRIIILLSDFDLPIVEKAITSLCDLHKGDNGDVEYINENFEFGDNDDSRNLVELLTAVYSEHPEGIIARPSFVTEREKRQDSVFMIFSNDFYIDGKIINETNIDEVIDKTYDYDSGVYFSIKHTIKEISRTQIERNYISVIINTENKLKILEQLDHIGINEANLFPELEYTAKHLKKKYKSIQKNTRLDIDLRDNEQIKSRNQNKLSRLMNNF